MLLPMPVFTDITCPHAIAFASNINTDLLFTYYLHLLLTCGAGEGGEAPFRLVGRVMKAHTRIIWACSWAPNGLCFATGARDSSIRIWALGAQGQGVHASPSAAPLVDKP